MISKLFKKPSFSLFNNFEFINELKNKVNEVVDAINNTPEPHSPVNYSTTEQNTGIKWIDGKDIYQKTFTIDDLTSITSGILIVNENLKLIKYDACIYQPTEGKRIPFSGDAGHNNSTFVNIYQDYYPNDGDYHVMLSGGSSYNGYKLEVTLYYTKG